MFKNNYTFLIKKVKQIDNKEMNLIKGISDVNLLTELTRELRKTKILIIYVFPFFIPDPKEVIKIKIIKNFLMM